MELPVWVINENACVDIKASIEHHQGVTLLQPAQILPFPKNPKG